MATTENLKVKITADASQAKAEISKFKDTLKGSIAAGDSALKTLTKLTAAAGALATALKATKAVIRNAVDVAAAGDAIKDNAQKVFMGTTAYQEWGYVLKQNGVEMGALKVGMRQFAQQVANGSDALTKYGITARDVDTAFQQAIYTIQNMSTETEKIAAATELFGTRALELFPILNLTNAETQNLMATYRAVGGTMSNELIAASDVCTDSITQMRAAWGGLRNLLATYVIPIIAKVVQWITIAIAYVRILLAAILGIKESFGGKGGGSRKTSLPATTGAVAGNTGKTAGNLKRAAKHAKELKRTLMGIDELTKLVEKATSQAASGGGGGGGGGIGGIGGGGVDLGEFEDVAGIFSDETLEKIEKFREKVEKVSDILHGLYLILKGIVELAFGDFSGAFSDFSEGLSLIFPDLTKKIETLKTKWDEFKKKVKEKITTAFEDKIAPKIKTLKEKWAGFKKKVKDYKVTVTLKSVGQKMVEKINNLWGKIKNKTATIKLQFIESMKAKWNAIATKVNAARAKSVLARTLIPSDLPYLAKGGVLTAPTAAIMGEYAGARSNPEIATPQSLMAETVRDANGDLVTAFAAMTRQVIAAIEDKDLTVKIGDETIARSAQRGNTAYYNRTGKALLTI